jgi:hypothetical protein
MTVIFILAGVGAAVAVLNFYLSFIKYPLHRLRYLVMGLCTAGGDRSYPFDLRYGRNPLVCWSPAVGVRPRASDRLERGGR